ncbi:MAG: hypothetical protein NTZ60_07555 [Campylobacterales bacterium]|nr:hypothetical protein [Campylobacterales bacterium]
MQNPFESGHIKNYVLLYVSVVVIMILFFIASMLFNDVKEVEKKVFDTNVSEFPHAKKPMENIEEVNGSRFKLLEKAY